MEGEELPAGWSACSLGELGQWSGGGTPSKSNPEFWTGGTIPWVSPKDMKTNHVRSAEDVITEAAVRGSAAKHIPAGSILMVTRSGILSHTFPVAINDCAVTVNQDLKTLSPSEGVDASYIAWFLRSNNHRILAECSKHGTTVSSIDTGRLKGLRVHLAPSAEQQRIVEKIETLFAELEKGEEALRSIQKLLARYRQSVLKAAVTGALTADWRAANGPAQESGHDLLTRILKTRRETWQGRGKYKEPVAPETDGLPDLPEGWAWASLGQLISVIEAGKNYRCEERPPEADEVGIVKISAVTWDVFDEQESKTVLTADHIDERNMIRAGDLLISRANTLELVGASVVVNRVSKNLQLSDKVLRLRNVLPMEHWLNFVLRSPFGRAQIESVATGAQMSMRNISQANLMNLCVPLPPLCEIEALEELITQERASTENLSNECSMQQSRATALRQSILKDAFSGKLVPQDPSDEPADKLLARIRVGRVRKPAAK